MPQKVQKALFLIENFDEKNMAFLVGGQAVCDVLLVGGGGKY
jgi:hypothetical protein